MRRGFVRALALVLTGMILAAPLRAQMPAESLQPTDAQPVDEAPVDEAPADAAPPDEELAPPETNPPETEQAPAPAAALIADDPFPFPEGLRGHVDFWTNVFGVWTNRQVVFHDMRFPALVYEVIDLVGPSGGTYTPEQQQIVRAHRAAIEARLRSLQVMVELKAPLTDDEKSLALLVATAAGTDALTGAADRVRSQRGIRDGFRRGLQISGRYDSVFRKIFVDAGLPADLACLPHVESSFQAQARSSAGAVGIWQFTRGAARIFMKLDSSIDERLDPVAAARGAARYLGTAHAQLGDWALAVTSYNHGVAGMSRARERFGHDFDRIVREYDGKLFGFASRNFYAEFLAARRIARDPQQWFPEGIAYDPPLATDEVILPASMPAQRIAMRYGVTVATLAALNPGWSKRTVRGGRALPAGISVWLPGGTLERIAAATRAPQAKPRASKAPATSLADFIVHVVRRGETLLQIASHHGVRLSDLTAANSLDATAMIHPGQQLRVPAVR